MEVLSPMKLAINLPATVEIDGADGSLLCPVCSATYIHQKAVTVFCGAKTRPPASVSALKATRSALR